MPLEIDFSVIYEAIKGAKEAISAGAKRGLQDVLDDWQHESRNVAPIDKGILRRNIETEVSGEKFRLNGTISANAYERGFNYAYYIHEIKGKDFVGRTPGTIGEFLDEPARQNEDRWAQQLEKVIQKEVKRRGW